MPISSSRASTSLSTRETKKDATECSVDRSPPLRAGLLETVEVGVHDLLVASQPEDQRDVDADALAQRLDDRGQSLVGGGDLDEQVGPVDLAPQLGADSMVPSVSKARLGATSIDTRPSTPPWPRDLRQRVAGVAHVVGGQLGDDVLDARAARVRPATWSSYRSPSASAAAKIVGLVVTPTTWLSRTMLGRLPDSIRSRDRSSSQIVTPAADSSAGRCRSSLLPHAYAVGCGGPCRRRAGRSCVGLLRRQRRGCCPRPRRRRRRP